ncbi:MAG: succinate dehydrogenase, cytochrome b556 subunit [Steroidobacteraceae bacterium]
MARRPLSPHLWIYRFGYTMSLSILHRGMGIVLSLGLVLFAVWLTAAAAGAESYDRLVSLLPAPLLKTGLALLVLAFVYHLANGIRHLFWDAGMGFERAQARRSAALVIAFTVIVAGGLIVLLFTSGAAS